VSLGAKFVITYQDESQGEVYTDDYPIKTTETYVRWQKTKGADPLPGHQRCMHLFHKLSSEYHTRGKIISILKFLVHLGSRTQSNNINPQNPVQSTCFRCTFFYSDLYLMSSYSPSTVPTNTSAGLDNR
jgi:hypothetical protein